ncbi:hypothetical protein ACH3XX_20125 [Streptomyces scabiei]|uniref:hypothetical protein n=1 Tax=Streptomyces scabiei TaxID=1930 RepID=UPI0037ACD720
MAAWDEQDERPRCGQPKRDGNPCQAHADLCRHHGAQPPHGTPRVRASDGAKRPDTAAKLDQAAALEAQGVATDVIATQLGVAAATVRDWRQRDEYREAVRQLRDELASRSYGRALANVDRAWDTIEQGQAGEANGTQVRAALGALAELRAHRAQADLDARVAELEALLRGGGDEW